MIPVKITVTEGACLPSYQTRGSSGADLHAFLSEALTIEPGSIALVPTGLFIELPYGYEAQIRPRSGLALKHGITLLNTPGTIDSDYRGEIKIIMANFGKDPFVIENGMRIAQMVFARTFRGDFEITGDLSGTDRNEGGFGHSGV